MHNCGFVLLTFLIPKEQRQNKDRKQGWGEKEEGRTQAEAHRGHEESFSRSLSWSVMQDSCQHLFCWNTEHLAIAPLLWPLSVWMAKIKTLLLFYVEPKLKPISAILQALAFLPTNANAVVIFACWFVISLLCLTSIYPFFCILQSISFSLPPSAYIKLSTLLHTFL